MEPGSRVKTTIVFGGLCILLSGCVTGSPQKLHTHEHAVSAKRPSAETPFRSWHDLRRRAVVMQRYDFSCGAGSLATIITHYFGDKVSEEDVLRELLLHLPQDKLEDRIENGFSLLDLKETAAGMGYQAAAVRLNYANLASIRGPVLVHVIREGYKHFTVYRGTFGARVNLADPSQGMYSMPIDQFVREWTGVALVLGKQDVGLLADSPLHVTEDDYLQDSLKTARRALYLTP